MHEPARTERAGLVSIVVPVYNAEPFLDRCVRSVTAQRYCDFELILVDDGSTDRSGELCDTYARNDARIRVAHVRNGGPSSARNAGLRLAQGEFLYFLDADDEMTPDALEVLLGLAREHPADWVVGGFRKQRQDGSGDNVGFIEGMVDGHDGMLASARKYLHRPNRYELFSYSWGRLYRGEIVYSRNLTFNEALFTYEDVDFNFRYLMHARGLYACERVLYLHRVHDNYSSSRTTFGRNPMRLMGHIDTLDTLRSFAARGGTAPVSADVDADLKHALIYLTIIQFVRLCGRLDADTFGLIRSAVTTVIGDPRVRAALPCYRPQPGDSVWLPRLMRWRLAIAAVLLSYAKARKRYGIGRRPK